MHLCLYRVICRSLLGWAQALAHTDALTGPPNWHGLQQVLTAALALIRVDRVLVVFLLDLDVVKPINDRLGHGAGGGLLMPVGQRLRQQLRNSDTVARLGGDEFLSLAAGRVGEAVAQRLDSKRLSTFDLAFCVAEQTCRVGLTVALRWRRRTGATALICSSGRMQRCTSASRPAPLHAPGQSVRGFGGILSTCRSCG